MSTKIRCVCFLQRTVLMAAVVAASNVAGIPAAHADVCHDGAVKPGPGPGRDWYQRQGDSWQYNPSPTSTRIAPTATALISPCHQCVSGSTSRVRRDMIVYPFM
jgi:hypothetical protein